MERGRHTPQLPEGLLPDDLRFVHPQLYPVDMAYKGWEVYLGKGVDGNEAKVSYSLSRNADGLDLEELKKTIGILDEEGNAINGYSLYVNQKDGEPARLEFNFTGFPTQKTMDVLQNLEGQFLAKDFKPRHFKMIASSEPMEETPGAKSLLARAKEIFHR